MSVPTRILIVEDEFAIALDIQQRLERMGYEPVAWVSTYDEAIVKVVELSPDIVLADIQLNQDKDGIETARQIISKFGLPVVFVTAFSDQATFEKALAAMPMGYVTKPFKDEDLRNNIELALRKHHENTLADNHAPIANAPENPFIYVKGKGKLQQITIDDIVYCEAMDNYTQIHVASFRHVVHMYLSDFFKELSPTKFIRIHRSFVVSIAHVTAIEDDQVILSTSKKIPVGNSFRKELFDRIRLVK